MEKRIGVLAILLEKRKSVPTVNDILSQYNGIVLGRLGLPLREKGVHVISLVIEGSNENIGALAGKIGRLPGVQVKSVLTKYREDADDEDAPN